MTTISLTDHELCAVGWDDPSRTDVPAYESKGNYPRRRYVFSLTPAQVADLKLTAECMLAGDPPNVRTGRAILRKIGSQS